MNELLLPIFIVVIASIFQGTFGLGMKYMKPMAWEAWWLIHATVAMVVFPLIWANLVVPNLGTVISNAPVNELLLGGILGFVWGIGGMMFGVSVGYIGMSLTYGIVMGLCSIAGALVPFVIRFDAINPSSIPFIISGLIILALAVYVVTIAGLKRDKCLIERGNQIEGIKTGSAFKSGLIIASVCGILSAALAIGFDNTVKIGELAILEGALERNSALARWVVVLAGAYLMNAGYALILLIKNKSYNSFTISGALHAVKWSIIAGLLWFAALGTYGQGVALMGEIGTMICWPVMLGLSLIVSNIAAWIAGEWKDMKSPFLILLLGVSLIIVATVLMAYASTLKIG
ncbi:MAG: L-rhamnose/proton symporter RhaT [Verrucomicrobiota bacterium]|nr:L-rhamnose/proton symporter RhaT [Verrucomicrobiota bacterium]